MTQRQATNFLKSACETLFVNGDFLGIPRFFSKDYVAHFTDGGELKGHKAIQGVIALYRQAFPKLECDVEVLVADGERIAWQRTLRGKHAAALRGFPSTGKKVVWREMVVSRLEDGVIAEEWVVTELVERMILARKTLAKGKREGREPAARK